MEKNIQLLNTPDKRPLGEISEWLKDAWVLYREEGWRLFRIGLVVLLIALIMSFVSMFLEKIPSIGGSLALYWDALYSCVLAVAIFLCVAQLCDEGETSFMDNLFVVFQGDYLLKVLLVSFLILLLEVVFVFYASFCINATAPEEAKNLIKATQDQQTEMTSEHLEETLQIYQKASFLVANAVLENEITPQTYVELKLLNDKLRNFGNKELDLEDLQACFKSDGVDSDAVKEWMDQNVNSAVLEATPELQLTAKLAGGLEPYLKAKYGITPQQGIVWALLVMLLCSIPLVIFYFLIWPLWAFIAEFPDLELLQILKLSWQGSMRNFIPLNVFILAQFVVFSLLILIFSLLAMVLVSVLKSFGFILVLFLIFCAFILLLPLFYIWNFSAYRHIYTNW